MGYVYLIGSPAFSQVKIGRSINDPRKRLSELQVGSPFLLKLLCMIYTEDPEDTEITLHNYFANSRTRGEWFTLGDDPVGTFKSGFATCFPEDEGEKFLRRFNSYTPGQRLLLAKLIRKMRRENGDLPFTLFPIGKYGIFRTDDRSSFP